jgi:hypothetical protein
MLTKDEFIQLYIGDRTSAAMARGALQEGERTLAEWQTLWQQTLNSPA